MKSFFLYGIVFSLAATFFSLSCVKEYSCEGCKDSNKLPNRPPVAIAGTDQTIFLPLNSATLDGSASADPDSNITSYHWTKISGPSSFTSNLNAARTQLTGLLEGIYLFELKVSDAGGLFSKDTVQIEVKGGVVSASVDTTFTDLIWLFWHQSNLPITDSLWDDIYLYTETRKDLLLNVADSDIRVFVKIEPGSDWIECCRFMDGTCQRRYRFKHGNSDIYVIVWPNDYSLVGRKASVRVVIK